MYQALPELKLTRVQRSSLVIIAHARREGPGDEARTYIHSDRVKGVKYHFIDVHNVISL